MSTGRKDHAVELKGIPEDIIAERMKADICLKCRKRPNKSFECYTHNPIMTRMVPKKDGVPQVRDISKTWNTEEV